MMRQNWVRRIEHVVLRVVSFGFSMASAYAIRLFFAPLDAVDRFEQVITWVIALGFGVLGYVVSRGLVHRMMHGERIRAYAPICLVVVVVDIACNYALAAEAVHLAAWLEAVPVSQQALLTTVTYVVLSVIPLVSLLLAVVDMDLERSKGERGGAYRPAAASGGVRPQPVTPRANVNGAQGNTAAYGRGYTGTPQVADGAYKGSQQARRAGIFSALQRRHGQDEPGEVRGASHEREFLHDPAKQLAEIP
jgi:hypothetical protein